MASRRHRTSRRHSSQGTFPPERLEQRMLLTAAPGTGADESPFTRLTWQGREIEAVRDSYVLRMPQTNAATSSGLWDYQSAVPEIVAGWEFKPLGRGFYEVSTSGASAQDVSAWAKSIGAIGVSPNAVSTPQAIRREANDPRYVSGELWGLNNRSQDADIDAPEAWAMQTGSKEIIVAVMDSGIDYKHRDLQQNLWLRTTAGVAIPGPNDPVPTGGTYQYGLFGWDSADNDDDVKPDDILLDIHGTHVAGTIGAKGNNAEGVTGVNWDVKIYSAKIFNDAHLRDGVEWDRPDYLPGTETSIFIDAVNRIIELRSFYDQNIVAVNMSFGHYWDSWAERAAIEDLNRAGILVVAAAGNGNPLNLTDYGLSSASNPFYPADYDLINNTPYTNVISVAASNQADELAWFSNWGPDVDIAAPGVDILSTIPTDFPPQTVGYGELSGTSMAAPHVTGVAALVAAEYLRWTKSLPSPLFMRQAILEGADSVSTLRFKRPDGTEHSIPRDLRLNARKAVEWCVNNLPPSISITPTRIPGRVPVGQLEGDTGTTPISFTATLLDIKGRETTATENIVVSYYTEDWEAKADIDFVGIPKTAPLTFTIPKGAKGATFTIDIKGDTIPEPFERFKVGFKTGSSGEAWLKMESVVGTIRDDDPDRYFPVVTIQSALTVSGGAAGLRWVPVQLSSGTDPKALRAVTVSYRVAALPDPNAPDDSSKWDPSGAVPRMDFVPQTGTIRILAGRTQGMIPIRLLDKGLAGTRSFMVELTDVAPGLIKFGQTRCVVTASTPPVPQLSVSSAPTAIAEGTGRNTPLFVTLALSTPATATVAIPYAFTNGSATNRGDYVANRGTAVIRPGRTTATIPFTILGDNRYEQDETFSLVLNANQIRGATLTGSDTVTFRILNDDPEPTNPRVTLAAAAFAAIGSTGEGNVSTRRRRI